MPRFIWGRGRRVSVSASRVAHARSRASGSVATDRDLGPGAGSVNGASSSARLTGPVWRRPTVPVLGVLGLAATVAASLYVLGDAAEAPEANAVVRAIMSLTALGVGLYLWQRQPQNWFGPALAGGVLVLSPMALAVSDDPWTFTIGRTVAALAIVYA